MAFNFDTAQYLSNITKSTDKVGTFADNEINRLQNIQNKMMSASDLIINMTGNQYLSNIRTGQAGILTNATADMYTSKAMRDNVAVAEAQTMNELSSMYTKQVNKGVSAIGNTIMGGTNLLYDLEDKKRMITMKKLSYETNKRQFNDKIRLGWSEYDLARKYLDLNWDKLDFTKETNLKQEGE